MAFATGYPARFQPWDDDNSDRSFFHINCREFVMENWNKKGKVEEENDDHDDDDDDDDDDEFQRWIYWYDVKRMSHLFMSYACVIQTLDPRSTYLFYELLKHLRVGS